MNEAALTQLKIIVERAVRPVRASIERKRTMREELLAHVSGVYEEELTRLGAERAALAQTTLRFGTPADVTRQLQASIPKRDRLDLLVDTLWLQPGESTWRRAIRHGLLTELWLALDLGLMLITYLIIHGNDWMQSSAWPGTPLLVFGGWAVGSCFLFVFSCTFLADWLRQALHDPVAQSSRTAFLVVLCAPLLVAALGICGVWMGALDNFWFATNGPLGILLFGLATAALLVILAQANQTRICSAEEWARLPLESAQ